MKTNETRNKTGLLINNFVNTLNYEIVIMREKILLFIHDLGFFHKLHIQYLKRFYDKILLFNMQLNEDVKLNSNTKPQIPTPVISVKPSALTQTQTQTQQGIVLSMEELSDKQSDSSNKTPNYAKALSKNEPKNEPKNGPKNGPKNAKQNEVIGGSNQKSKKQSTWLGSSTRNL